MGGIGKTTLALAYGWEALDHKAYELIYWIHSETEENLFESYKKLLRTLKVPLKADDTQEQLIDLVKEHITQKQKWLLIYDNVPHPTFLENKTPQYGGHIVITSRCNEGWGYQPLGLEVFQPSEATAYLFRTLGIQPSQRTGEQQEQTQAIARELGCLPLALSHAASYMSYLKEAEPFKHYLQKLSSFPDHSLGRQSTLLKKDLKLTHEYFIDKTLNIAGELISPLARRLLTYFSYLDPEHIKADYFIGRNNYASEEVQEALAQLRAFSLIREHQGFISLHRLLQLVIRNKESMCFKSLSTNILTPMLICFENYIENLEESIKTIILNEKKIYDNIEYIVQLYENAYMFPSHVKSVYNHLNCIPSVKKHNEEEDFLLKLRFELLERYQTESVFSLLRNALNKILRYLRLSEDTKLLDKYKKRIKTLAIQEEFRMREIDLYNPLFKEVEKVLPEIFSLHKGKEDTIYIAELCKSVETEKRLKYIDHLEKLLSSEQEERDAMRWENHEYYIGEPLLSRLRKLGITEHPFLIMFITPEMPHRERLRVLDNLNIFKSLWQQLENYIKENQ